MGLERAPNDLNVRARPIDVGFPVLFDWPELIGFGGAESAAGVEAETRRAGRFCGEEKKQIPHTAKMRRVPLGESGQAG